MWNDAAMLNIGLLLWFFKYTSAKCEKVPIICAFFSSSKLIEPVWRMASTAGGHGWWGGQELHCSQVGPHLGTRVPMGTFFRFWVPKRSPFFQGPHYLPFQAEERAKSQSSHYLLDVDNLNSCDDKTSFNLYTCTPNEATLCEGVFL